MRGQHAWGHNAKYWSGKTEYLESKITREEEDIRRTSALNTLDLAIAAFGVCRSSLPRNITNPAESPTDRIKLEYEAADPDATSLSIQ